MISVDLFELNVGIFFCNGIQRFAPDRRPLGCSQKVNWLLKGSFYLVIISLITT